MAAVGRKAQGFGRAHHDKAAVPRHRTQSRVSSAAQERAVERRCRQAARRAIEEGLAEDVYDVMVEFFRGEG